MYKVIFVIGDDHISTCGVFADRAVAEREADHLVRMFAGAAVLDRRNKVIAVRGRIPNVKRGVTMLPATWYVKGVR